MEPSSLNMISVVVVAIITSILIGVSLNLEKFISTIDNSKIEVLEDNIISYKLRYISGQILNDPNSFDDPHIRANIIDFYHSDVKDVKEASLNAQIVSKAMVALRKALILVGLVLLVSWCILILIFLGFLPNTWSSLEGIYMIVALLIMGALIFWGASSYMQINSSRRRYNDLVAGVELRLNAAFYSMRSKSGDFE